MEQYLAKTFFGLENVLADELKQLGAHDIKTGNRAVHFKGDKELMYKANLHLRTALRVLKPIDSFIATSVNEFYDKIYAIDWEKRISPSETIAVDSVVISKYFTHHRYVALKTKDAVVDRIRDKRKRRPSVNVKNPNWRIHVHIAHDRCDVSLDSSGDALYKRGYRTKTGPAPMNEVLAAGLVLLSGWNNDRPLYDLMCGSGTILIEAALIAKQLPPNFYRYRFGFQKWRDYDEQLWKKVLQESRSTQQFVKVPITGVDIDPMAVSAAKTNVGNANLANSIQIVQKAFTGFIPMEDNVLVISNPPYGERLEKDADLMSFYKNLGRHLKFKMPNCDAWLFSGNTGAMKQIGLRPSEKLILYNGGLECRYAKYELYEGSRSNPSAPEKKTIDNNTK